MKKLVNNNLFKILFWIFILIAASVFTYMYVYNEDPIYIFDYSGYFENYKIAGNYLSQGIGKFFKEIYNTIQNNDYNYSSLVLLMPIYCLLGTSRFSYILSLVLVYLVPSIFITFRIIKLIIIKYDNDKRSDYLFNAFIIFSLFMYTRFWSPTLRGLSDICGLLFIALSYLYVLKHPFNKKQRIYESFILSLLIYIPFLFRRWYAYFIVSFLVSCFLFDLYDFIKVFKYKEKRNNLFKIYFWNYLKVIIFIIGLLFCVQFEFVKHILANNYANLYSSYQYPFLNHITNFISEFGLVIVLIMIVSIVLSMIYKKYLREILFSFTNFILFSLLFSRVQMMGVHHYLGISLWVIIIVILGIKILYDILHKNKWILIAFLLLFAINFSTTFIFRNLNIPIITQSNKYCKFRYTSMAELNRLIDDLEYLASQDSEENIKFSVISESENLSDNLIDLLGDISIKDNIVYTSHMDSRDDLTYNALMTKYVVVTNPPQAGSNYNSQHVITVPDEAIYENVGLGKAYNLYSGPYILQNDVMAYIYEKKRSFSLEESQDYINSMINYNDLWKSSYTPFDTALLSSQIKLGSYYGAYSKTNMLHQLIFYPGGTNTELAIPTKNLDGELSLTFYMQSDNKEGEVLVKILLNKKEIYNFIIDNKNSESVVINLDNKKDLEIVIDKNKELVNDYLVVDYEFKEN